MTECIFCKVAAGDIPADLAGQTDEFVAFSDINPVAPVHLLVIPRRHVASLDGVEELGAGASGRLLAFIAAMAREAGVAESGYRVVTNVGVDARQQVLHLHWHILGGERLGGMV
jgi:histidine triad (HIT) family protein